MINYDHIMVRFGELNTKGKNKKDFIRTLYINIKAALKEWPNLTLENRYDHIYVGLNNTPYQEVMERLQEVSGIHALSLVYRSEKDVDTLKEMYPELEKNKETITNVLVEEKNKFMKTLENGEREFMKAVEKMRREGKNKIDGQTVFNLYETYGFPQEVTIELARENGVELEDDGVYSTFDKCMNELKDTYKNLFDTEMKI